MEGVETILAGEDVDAMSAVVGLMSAEDLEHGLEMARVAGELWAVGDVIDMLQMPVLAVRLLTLTYWSLQCCNYKLRA